jgi:hypothetical protein
MAVYPAAQNHGMAPERQLTCYAGPGPLNGAFRVAEAHSGCSTPIRMKFFQPSG